MVVKVIYISGEKLHVTRFEYVCVHYQVNL
jgi:hypothetical protein